MATYKKKYYKASLVKANNDYTCEISGTHIAKGEHYLLLQIEEANQKFTFCGSSYTPTKTIRVSTQLFGAYNMEEILDRTNMFEKDNEAIARLKKENVVLKQIIRQLTEVEKS